ncbi:MAG: hypothetical protein AAFV80_05120, partial [Bacteroidota bacterium]
MLSKYPLRILVLVQLLLILIAFNKAWVHPNEYFFSEVGDGYKNYLTFYGYLADEDNSMAKFEGMNYPFGEYVFYTDNTPTIALPLKFISRHIVDLTGIALPLFNGLIILGLLWSSVLCFWILKRFVRTPIILVVASVALPWMSPQFLRLEVGHFNLSLSCLLLWTLFLSMRVEERWQDGRKGQILSFLWLFAALVFAAFTHLYYIAIAGVAIGAYFFGRILWQDRNQTGQWIRFGLAAGAIVLALVTVLATIQITDGYYDQRRTVAEGYDFNEWRLNIWGFYSRYSHLSLPIPTVKDRYVFLETHAFLGTCFWYAMILLFLLRILEPEFFRRFWKGRSLEHASDGAKNQVCWLYAILFSGAVGAFIGLGETVEFFGKYKLPNLLNPFYYLHMITDRVEQFRCIGRFSWLFFWGANFLMLYWIDQIWRQDGKKWIRRALVFLLIVLGFQAVETVSHQNKQFRKNNLTHEKYTGQARELAQQINPEEFQAIIPLPFFMVGSEVYPMTIDPPEPVFQLSTCLYVQTGIPLMASKMSRTSVTQTEAQLSLFLDEKPKPELTDRLNEKDLLLLYSKQYNQDFSWYVLNMEPSKTVALGAQKFIETYQPEEIYQN